MKGIWTKFITILTMVTLMLTLVPGITFAATTNIGLTVPYVEADVQQTIGALRITETESTEGSIASGDEIIITLSSSAEFSKYDADNVGVLEAALQAAVNFSSDINFVDVRNVTNESFVLEIGNRTNSSEQAWIQVDFGATNLEVDITSGSGDFEVEVYSPDGHVTNGMVTLAHIVDGNTISSALNIKNISVASTNQELGKLRIAESNQSALDAGEKIKLELPSYFTWTGSAPTISLAGGFNTGDITYTGVEETGSGNSALVFDVVNSSSNRPGVIELSDLRVDVTENAPTGDLLVKVGGDCTEQDVVLAKVISSGVGDTDKPFVLTKRNLDRTGGLKATVTVVRTIAEDHAGKEVVVFQLMKGQTPHSIVALEKDIQSSEELTAYFNVTGSDYYVKTYVLDQFNNNPDTVHTSLADSEILN